MTQQTEATYTAERFFKGPRAFSHLDSYRHQSSLERILERVPDALQTGGFMDYDIERNPGFIGTMGMIEAIRRGYVDCIESIYYKTYRINDAGKDYLKTVGKPAPDLLPVLDGWHNSRAEYCVYQVERGGAKYAQIAREVTGAHGNLAMSPLLNVDDAKALRDWLSKFIDGNDASQTQKPVVQVKPE